MPEMSTRFSVSDTHRVTSCRIPASRIVLGRRPPGHKIDRRVSARSRSTGTGCPPEEAHGQKDDDTDRKDAFDADQDDHTNDSHGRKDQQRRNHRGDRSP